MGTYDPNEEKEMEKDINNIINEMNRLNRQSLDSRAFRQLIDQMSMWHSTCVY